MILSGKNTADEQVTEKKTIFGKIREYFYETGELCAPGVIVMNGSHYVPAAKECCRRINFDAENVSEMVD